MLKIDKNLTFGTIEPLDYSCCSCRRVSSRSKVAAPPGISRRRWLFAVYGRSQNESAFADREVEKNDKIWNFVKMWRENHCDRPKTAKLGHPSCRALCLFGLVVSDLLFLLCVVAILALLTCRSHQQLPIGGLKISRRRL